LNIGETSIEGVMRSNDLDKTAQALVAGGTGIAAADETVPTVTRWIKNCALRETRRELSIR
jgi:hypothetical protein